MCPWRDEWINKMGISLSLRRDGDSDKCSNIHEPGRHYVSKMHQSQKTKYVLNGSTYMRHPEWSDSQRQENGGRLGLGWGRGSRLGTVWVAQDEKSYENVYNNVNVLNAPEL